jgi:hypothetical protein
MQDNEEEAEKDICRCGGSGGHTLYPCHPFFIRSLKKSTKEVNKLFD